MLAKRLINSLSFSMYAEEIMINRLRIACGYEFTNKFHRMFTDISVSEGLKEKFNNHNKKENHQLDVDFSILVLSTGSWPVSQANLITFSLPQELERSVRLFEEFYNTSYNGRKLTWMHYLCTTDIRLTYLKRPYSITMSIFQMSILLCFNSSLSLNVKDIQETTQLPFKELIKQIQSLVDSKLINKDDTTQDLTDTSQISLNTDYTNKRTKFKINTTVQKDAVQVTKNQQLFLNLTILWKI
jgi:cullin 2